MSSPEAAEAARQAVAAHAADILAYFERRVSPIEDAADLTSEVMLVAWRRRSHLPRGDVDARKWLFGIARMTLSNHQRSARRRDRLTEQLRSELRVAHRAEPDQDAAADVRAAIGSLPTDLAELVRLVHWDGFSIAEAAEVCGISAFTARTRYQRARQQLAERLSVFAPAR